MADDRRIQQAKYVSGICKSFEYWLQVFLVGPIAERMDGSPAVRHQLIRSNNFNLQVFAHELPLIIHVYVVCAAL